MVITGKKNKYSELKVKELNYEAIYVQPAGEGYIRKRKFK